MSLWPNAGGDVPRLVEPPGTEAKYDGEPSLGELGLEARKPERAEGVPGPGVEAPFVDVDLDAVKLIFESDRETSFCRSAKRVIVAGADLGWTAGESRGEPAAVGETISKVMGVGARLYLGVLDADSLRSGVGRPGNGMAGGVLFFVALTVCGGVVDMKSVKGSLSASADDCLRRLLSERFESEPLRLVLSPSPSPSPLSASSCSFDSPRAVARDLDDEGRMEKLLARLVLRGWTFSF